MEGAGAFSRASRRARMAVKSGVEAPVTVESLNEVTLVMKLSSRRSRWEESSSLTDERSSLTGKGRSVYEERRRESRKVEPISRFLSCSSLFLSSCSLTSFCSSNSAWSSSWALA